MNDIKLGIIGMSEGNGHPYSWASIFNGFDPVLMKDCPFRDIYEYLSKRKYPEDAIQGARVTHIWTQDKSCSRNIAASARIDHVVDDYRDLIGNVDAVLLARDDAEHHEELSKPFLESGMPVYVDKPFSTTVSEAKRIFEYQQYEGQVFTCSALRYAQELRLDQKDRNLIGPIKCVEATSMKDWNRYAVHMIEPVLQLMGDQGAIQDTQLKAEGEWTEVEVLWKSGLKATFQTTGKSSQGISIRVIGEKSVRVLRFHDSFSAFRSALEAFIGSISNPKLSPDRGFVLKVVEIIEKGHVPCKPQRLSY